MSTHRRSRISPGAVERLLAGATPTPQEERLALLLAEMRAPATQEDLAGETAALAAYRAANLAPVRQPRRRSMLKTALAKLLTVKAAAAAAVAITATGGVALAASAGVLPNPASDRGAPAARPSAHATGKPATAGAEKAGSAAPSPSLVGLCRAYAADAGDNPGKALENPAFQALITAAGSKDDVAGYCDDVLAGQEAAGTTSGGAPTARPSKAPAERPSAGPDDHPTGPPATAPTDGTHSRPTVAPTAPPTS
jgi:hypothetical protein